MTKDYRILRDTLEQVIQNSGLNIGAVYYITKDLLNDLEKLFMAQVNDECLAETKTENISVNTENKENTTE